MVDLFRGDKRKMWDYSDDGLPSEIDNKGIEVILKKSGDMLVYKGMILEHWREGIYRTRL